MRIKVEQIARVAIQTEKLVNIIATRKNSKFFKSFKKRLFFCQKIFDKTQIKSYTIPRLKSENYIKILGFYPLLKKFIISSLFKWGLV